MDLSKAIALSRQACIPIQNTHSCTNLKWVSACKKVVITFQLQGRLIFLSETVKVKRGREWLIYLENSLRLDIWHLDIRVKSQRFTSSVSNSNRHLIKLGQISIRELLFNVFHVKSFTLSVLKQITSVISSVFVGGVECTEKQESDMNMNMKCLVHTTIAIVARRKRQQITVHEINYYTYLMNQTQKLITDI